MHVDVITNIRCISGGVFTTSYINHNIPVTYLKLQRLLRVVVAYQVLVDSEAAFGSGAAIRFVTISYRNYETLAPRDAQAGH